MSENVPDALRTVARQYDDYDALIADLEAVRAPGVRPAGPMIRFAATGLDFVAWLVVSGVGGIVVPYFSIISFPLLFVFMPWKFGFTPGKWLCRIREVGADLEPPSLNAALLRALAKWWPVYGMAFLGAVLKRVSTRNRGVTFDANAGPIVDQIARMTDAQLVVFGALLAATLYYVVVAIAARFDPLRRMIHDVIADTRVIGARRGVHEGADEEE